MMQVPMQDRALCTSHALFQLKKVMLADDSRCVDKLYFVLYVKNLASDERRNAELALYSGNVNEAEAILPQAHPTPLVY
ncbi:hypothetical protein GN244_ATG10193 [Phytophthora infestans]|uniref:IFT80/172/WDR35 TPR domain-containing protein n=1 Tax=Phytophthora infestans TaxID=4787 RepID=A0A833WUG7_PHYIN|nr:hypothetical protein GN244_ATG10193 [Phytophthora infestans]KAF4134441.1 hypothetical protein GN958_ATG16376 [Phytophthora infestans]